jgi:thioredoxin-related protein
MKSINVANNWRPYFVGICLIFAIPFHGSAQEEGIQFESKLSWKEIQAKAKSEHKMIFMDCYATWCGPCKWMAKNVFSQKEVGAYFNSHFVCVAVQLDMTASDSQHVKDWYSDADEIKQAYNIQDYPTYLFFATEGKAVHRFIGTTEDGASFIAKASEALDPSKQYYTKMSLWEQHKADTGFLWSTYMTAKENGDNDQASAIAAVYLETQTNLFSKRNLLLTVRSGQLRSSQSKWFQFFLDHSHQIDDSMDGTNGIAHYVAWVLLPTILNEDIKPIVLQGERIYWSSVDRILLKKYAKLGRNLEDLVKYEFGYQIGQAISGYANKSQNPRPDWVAIARTMRQKYPDYDFREVLFRREVKYYQIKEQWTACAEAAYTLMHGYAQRIDDFDMNEIAWDNVFQHCDNRKIITEAIRHMKYVIEIKKDSDADYLDTYANLFYKLGNTRKALLFEEKAIEVAEKRHAHTDEISTWQDNINKMKQGEPTWVNKSSAS